MSSQLINRTKCDRCGKTWDEPAWWQNGKLIFEYNKHKIGEVKHRYYKFHSTKSEQDQKESTTIKWGDLCTQCTNSFINWLRDGQKEDQ